ncbi:MAG TPA: MarC family protein [Crinalium sp.]
MHQFLFHAIATFLALLPIANPLGAIPIFHSLTETGTRSHRRYQAWHTSINVIWVLALFFVAGQFILEFLHISLGVLRIAGGLLVAHTAWEMATSHQKMAAHKPPSSTYPDDISFTPMAVPLVSGPGAIGVVMSLSATANYWPGYMGCLFGIVLLGASLYACLALGDPLFDRLGKHGTVALNRLLSFFILAIAIQFIADGTFSLLKDMAQELLPH